MNSTQIAATTQCVQKTKPKTRKIEKLACVDLAHIPHTHTHSQRIRYILKYFTWNETISSLCIAFVFCPSYHYQLPYSLIALFQVRYFQWKLSIACHQFRFITDIFWTNTYMSILLWLSQYSRTRDTINMKVFDRKLSLSIHPICVSFSQRFVFIILHRMELEWEKWWRRTSNGRNNVKIKANKVEVADRCYQK